MNNLVALSLIAAASAFSNDKVAHLPQQPLLNDACPSTSILNGECQPPTYDPTTGNISFRQNSTQTLQQSYESAQKIANFPWSHYPECFANENTTEPYCVFSDQKFASGRGIFIVTTSAMAYEMLKKPAFTDPEALSRINNHDNPPFETHEFPMKGRGLIANKTLHRGDQIFASSALLITNPDAYHLVEEERLKLIHRGVDTLPEATKPLFWALLDHFKGDPVDDRINTNAFEIEINGHTQHAVLPEIAMLNHDCRPNAAYFWDEETLSHYVHATQTIYPGEEITITYINNERSRAKRMANLKMNWGFDCDCSSCSAHPSFYAESDARIQRMEELISHLNNWTPESKATPELAETLISLYEQERLFASLGVPYKHAAETYSSFGDKWNAVKYATLSAELSMLDKGFRDRDVRDMRAMAKDPELSWSWNKRVGHKRFPETCGHHHH
ncbi:SET domain-containing protein [Melanomma pulvis-pyrius CBS 109.77]|uniref:SET domain-containing protein n=1 Tax=Melanomma pulvis-pyrius CBS 109.77 TaxID=1314802 RepID=A0A6A6WTP3_9PLEO|nr:SET domain-containing protein [Melanomma pulvis-pyrius CBS 109.77]